MEQDNLSTSATNTPKPSNRHPWLAIESVAIGLVEVVAVLIVFAIVQSGILQILVLTNPSPNVGYLLELGISLLVSLLIGWGSAIFYRNLWRKKEMNSATLRRVFITTFIVFAGIYAIFALMVFALQNIISGIS